MSQLVTNIASKIAVQSGTVSRFLAVKGFDRLPTDKRIPYGQRTGFSVSSANAVPRFGLGGATVVSFTPAYDDPNRGAVRQQMLGDMADALESAGYVVVRKIEMGWVLVPVAQQGAK